LGCGALKVPRRPAVPRRLPLLANIPHSRPAVHWQMIIKLLGDKYLVVYVIYIGNAHTQNAFAQARDLACYIGC
jgi:hypothetical protein